MKFIQIIREVKITPLIILGVVIFGCLIALREEVSNILLRALIAVFAVLVLYITIRISRGKKDDA
jgi:hypothetical protein